MSCVLLIPGVTTIGAQLKFQLSPIIYLWQRTTVSNRSVGLSYLSDIIRKSKIPYSVDSGNVLY